MLKLLSDFPVVDDSPHASSCILFGHGDSVSPHYFVYEVARDFLSAPRTFVVVEIFFVFLLAWQLIHDNFFLSITELWSLHSELY